MPTKMLGYIVHNLSRVANQPGYSVPW